MIICIVTCKHMDTDSRTLCKPQAVVVIVVAVFCYTQVSSQPHRFACVQGLAAPVSPGVQSSNGANSPAAAGDAVVEDTAAQLRAAFDEVVKPSPTLKVLTWNVNGIRAFLKKREDAGWGEYLVAEDPDIICLNETKISDSDVQALGDVFPGYPHVQWHCSTAKKGYVQCVAKLRLTHFAAQCCLVAPMNCCGVWR